MKMNSGINGEHVSSIFIDDNDNIYIFAVLFLKLLIKSLEINPKFSAARIMLAEAYTNLYQFSMALYEIEKIDNAFTCNLSEEMMEKITMLNIESTWKILLMMF